MQYGLPMPVGLLRADNNLPPWRPGLKEVILYKKKNPCTNTFVWKIFLPIRKESIYLAVCLDSFLPVI